MRFMTARLPNSRERSNTRRRSPARSLREDGPISSPAGHRNVLACRNESDGREMHWGQRPTRAPRRRTADGSAGRGSTFTQDARPAGSRYTSSVQSSPTHWSHAIHRVDARIGEPVRDPVRTTASPSDLPQYVRPGRRGQAVLRAPEGRPTVARGDRSGTPGTPDQSQFHLQPRRGDRRTRHLSPTGTSRRTRSRA